jgi:hypothetical protein
LWADIHGDGDPGVAEDLSSYLLGGLAEAVEAAGDVWPDEPVSASLAIKAVR